MKFGFVDQDELSQISWELPKTTYDFASKNTDFSVKTGCAKWTMDSWTGVHYPEDTKKKDQLSAYTKLFDSIELNSTFYRLSRTSIEKWMEEVTDIPFTFCPKWSRRVSHLKRLNDVDENIQYFVDSCALFKEKLGPTFLQMPDNFTPKYIARMEHFFQQLPAGFKVHVELRHKDWFIDPTWNELLSLLKKYNHGLVITDVAGRRDVLHMTLVDVDVFIRFNGYGPVELDNERLDKWIELFPEWKSNGVGTVYFFFHHADEVLGPTNALYFQDAVKSLL